MTRALALVDGEHYPPVVREALRAQADAGHELVAALLVGGGEKLRAEPVAADYGVPRLERAGPRPWDDVRALVGATGCDVVLDLSDEPVLSQRLRLRLAGAALAAGAGYAAAGMRLDAPVRAPYALPAVAVVGTGKRVGKTAVACALARRAAARLGRERVVVVAMGRGGPALPELVDPACEPLGVAGLLARSRDGQHAASDYLEDAVLAGVATVGCRRCGGGPAGEVVWSNVPAGAELAAARGPALTILEGSGAAFPPVRSDRTLLVASSRTPLEELEGYLGPYRVLVADGAVVTGAEVDPDAAAAVAAAIRGLRPELPVVLAALAAEPATPVRGRRVAAFTTAPLAAHGAIARDLAGRHGAEVLGVSGALADRARLRDDLDGPLGGADVYVVEIKAAAVDVVAEAAAARGREVVWLANAPIAVDGSDAVERLLDALIDGARA